MTMIAKTVNFDSYNSFTDLGIIFKSFELSAPKPRLSYVDVPYRNGKLDLTDFFGDVRYESRELNFDFIIPWESNEQLSTYSNVLNKLNGRRMKIVISADEDWYYEGRVSVGDAKIEDGMWQFQASAEVDPYKYKDISLTANIANNGSHTFECNNDVMKAVPSIFTTRAITLSYNSTQINITDLDVPVKLLSITLEEGQNNIVVTNSSGSSATVIITYREGRL